MFRENKCNEIFEPRDTRRKCDFRENPTPSIRLQISAGSNCSTKRQTNYFDVCIPCSHSAVNACGKQVGRW